MFIASGVVFGFYMKCEPNTRIPNPHTHTHPRRTRICKCEHIASAEGTNSLNEDVQSAFGERSTSDSVSNLFSVKIINLRDFPCEFSASFKLVSMKTRQVATPPPLAAARDSCWLLHRKYVRRNCTLNSLRTQNRIRRRAHVLLSALSTNRLRNAVCCWCAFCCRWLTSALIFAYHIASDVRAHSDFAMKQFK